MAIILCGPPRSGKTTIGLQLSKWLSWSFLDTDHLIEEEYSRDKNRLYSCRQIFLQEGELSFRALESKLICSIEHNKRRCVISVGGGALLDENNRKKLKELGLLICLEVEYSILWSRLHKGSLPAFIELQRAEQSFYEEVEKRMSICRRAADLTVPIGHLDEEASLEQICRFVKEYHG